MKEYEVFFQTPRIVRASALLCSYEIFAMHIIKITKKIRSYSYMNTYSYNNESVCFRNSNNSGKILDSASNKKLYNKRQIRELKRKIRQYLDRHDYHQRTARSYLSHYIRSSWYFKIDKSTMTTKRAYSKAMKKLDLLYGKIMKDRLIVNDLVIKKHKLIRVQKKYMVIDYRIRNIIKSLKSNINPY